MKSKLFFIAAATYIFATAGCAQNAVGPKTVVVYGDSITMGAQLQNPNQRWASLVETQSNGTLKIINEGKGGRPTASLTEFEVMLKRVPATNLLVIALGANDARDISSRCVPNAVQNIKMMIGRARETYGVKLPVLIVGPTNIRKESLGPSKPIATEREANLKTMNEAFPELAKAENCAFVSTYGVVPDASLTKDGVHPDAAGHEALAKIMLPAITGAVGNGATVAAVPNSKPKMKAIELRLWDGAAPNAPENAGEEITGPDGRTRNVSVPTLTAYLPEKKLANAPAVIMCSGGGYTQLALQKYADLGTEGFGQHGFAVFNLKYRLKPPSKDARAAALSDAKRAVRLVRSRAEEWGVDPNRIGLIGASAGANLILNLMTTADAGQANSPDAIEHQSSLPNFAGLLSSWPGDQKITDFRFTKATPIFLLHTEDDKSAKIEFAREIEAAAKAAGVPVNAKYYATGGHDAFGTLTGPHDDWSQSFRSWFQSLR